MKHLILGTAGHIDHGKTALVKALTGTDTDRLPEEKARGITIDLGFANLRIGDLSFGIVDVPGHEDFIRNMLAGATGMDAVLLVIAADEGVRPQTREHLAILDLLNVRAGVIAITKIDLVDADWLSLIIDDVRQTLCDTSLANAPIVPVSVVTSEGLDDLRAAIAEQAVHTRGDTEDLLRMPVDRVFTVKGTGTVVTGTVWSGQVDVDETVIVMPSAARCRVRAIQIHGEAAPNASAGARAAIALSGIEKSLLSRGDTLVSTNIWPAAKMLIVAARTIDETEWQLKTRQRVRVHIGTAEVLARVVMLEDKPMAAGECGWIQLRLETPTVVRAGDRVVLRSYSPVTTIAGGMVAEISEHKRMRLARTDFVSLQKIVEDKPAEAAAAAIQRRGAKGISTAELSIHTPHAPTLIVKALLTLGSTVVSIGERWFASDVVLACLRTVIDATEQLHAEHPLKPAVERAEVRARVKHAAPELVEHAIGDAIKTGELTAQGGGVARKGFQPVLSARQADLKERLLTVITTGGLAPPTVAELALLGGDVESLLRLLVHDGLVESVSPDLYVERTVLEGARARTQTELVGKQPLAASDFRMTLPVSRKHLIPLLEYFDRTGVTVRQGDMRKVVPASEQG
jgi:selenocysteine-specific elongation factor